MYNLEVKLNGVTLNSYTSIQIDIDLLQRSITQRFSCNSDVTMLLTKKNTGVCILILDIPKISVYLVKKVNNFIFQKVMQ